MIPSEGIKIPRPVKQAVPPAPKDRDLERELDEALEGTFPASDPVSSLKTVS
ncbi:MAG TPA: hypothetical protein VGM26_04485 [Rhizomicrobium sp.]|jgi:hypothetical protein